MSGILKEIVLNKAYYLKDASSCFALVPAAIYKG